MGRKKFFRFNRLVDIPIGFLGELEIKCVMLDIDSTLLVWRGKQVEQAEVDWCNKVKASGMDIILVSNAKTERTENIAKQIDVKFIPTAFKPFPFGLLKAARICNTKRKNCIMIGDQLVTDKMAARFAGIKFILLEPLSDIEMGLTRMNRWVERNILRRKSL